MQYKRNRFFFKGFQIFLYQGDSGGPFTYKQNDQHVLIGVTSWGRGASSKPGTTCGDSSMFLRISHVRSWIDEKLTNTKFCKFAGVADQDNE